MAAPSTPPAGKPSGAVSPDGDVAGPSTSAAQTPEDADFDALQSILRLAVGGALEGSDEAVRRLKAQEARVRASGADAPTVEHDETDADRARYAAIGLLFEGERALRAGLSVWERSAALAVNAAARAAKPVTSSRLARPWQQRYDQLADRGAGIVDRWVQTGRIEEPRSRAMMLGVAGQAIDDTIDELAELEGVQQIVQQQSVGMATMMVGEARERTATGDNLIEQITHRLLRRPPPSSGAPSAASESVPGCGTDEGEVTPCRRSRKPQLSRVRRASSAVSPRGSSTNWSSSWHLP